MKLAFGCVVAATSTLLLGSCTDSQDQIQPPATIELSTVGDICTYVRDGLENDLIASKVAIGSCEEQKSPNGGRVLWIEFNDFASLAPGLTTENAKYVQVAVPLTLAAYGFVRASETPDDFEQLYFSFRDEQGSYFEISPTDMSKLLPEPSMSQDEWTSHVEKQIASILPRIEIKQSYFP